MESESQAASKEIRYVGSLPLYASEILLPHFSKDLPKYGDGGKQAATFTVLYSSLILNTIIQGSKISKYFAHLYQLRSLILLH
jgi:hypothetical protein